MPLKATSSNAAEYLKICLIDQKNFNEVHFRVKSSVLMGQVKKSYADRVEEDLQSMRFIFKSKVVKDDDTPRSIGMYENSAVKVYPNNNKIPQTAKQPVMKPEAKSITFPVRSTVPPMQPTANSANISENASSGKSGGVQPSSDKENIPSLCNGVASLEISENKNSTSNIAIPEDYADKPATSEASSTESKMKYITLIIVDDKFDEYLYNVMYNMPLKKLKHDYAEKKGVDASMLRFFFDAREVTDTDTPAALGMVTEDAIDVFFDY